MCGTGAFRVNRPNLGLDEMRIGSCVLLPLIRLMHGWSNGRGKEIKVCSVLMKP